MSFFPGGYFGGWYGGYASPYGYAIAPTAETPTPDKPPEPQEPQERTSVLVSRGYYPGFDKAPPPGLETWWLMRRYSVIALAHAVTVGPAMAGTRTIEVQDDQGKPNEAQRRKDIASKRILPQLEACLAGAFESLNFGHWLYEIEWTESPDGIAPVLHSVLPGEATLYRDQYRQFAGYKIGANDYRDSRYGCLFTNNPHVDPIFGESRNEFCREEWWRARQSENNADRIERKASGTQLGIGVPQGATWIDSNGKALFPKDLAQTITDAAVAGNSFTFPLCVFRYEDVARNPDLLTKSAIDLKQIDWGNTGPALLAHIARLDKLQRDIMRARLRPEREAMEGVHGTKAEAGTHGAIGTTDTELVHAQVCQQFTRQVLNRWEQAVFGGEPMLRAEPAPLSDPQQEFLQGVVKQLATDTATGPDLVQHINLRSLAETVELPLLSEEEVKKHAADKAEQEAEQQKQQAEQFKQQQQNMPPNGNGNRFAKQIAASIEEVWLNHE